jgi:hypothetical protein
MNKIKKQQHHFSITKIVKERIKKIKKLQLFAQMLGSHDFDKCRTLNRTLSQSFI